jgi:hypothetical protein
MNNFSNHSFEQRNNSKNHFTNREFTGSKNEENSIESEANGKYITSTNRDTKKINKMSTEIVNSITSFLQQNNLENPIIVVYQGAEINSYVTNCKLDVNLFNSILDKTQKISSSRTVYKRRTYFFHEMKKTVITKFNNGTFQHAKSRTNETDRRVGEKKREKREEYHRMFPVKCFRQKDMVFVIYENLKAYSTEFPVINKYDDCTDESVTEFTHEKNGYFLKSYFCKSKHNIITFELKFIGITKKDRAAENERKVWASERVIWSEGSKNSIESENEQRKINEEISSQIYVLANFVNSVC